jgi:MFS family permease
VLYAVTASAAISVAISFTFWNFVCLLAILLLKPSSQAVVSDEEIISYKAVLKTRSVLFYFIVWLMFSLINTFVYPILSIAFANDYQLIQLVTIFETLLAGILAVFFGFCADRFGRKRLLFVGFVTLGLGYAVLGLFPSYAIGLYFYTLSDAIAWGIFCPLFLFTVWGDLAGKKGSEKFFVIGILPYLISNFLAVLTVDSVLSVINMTTMFTFVCIFLFIAVIPLYLSTDTLSDKELEESKFIRYSNKAQAMADEWERNSQSSGLRAKVRAMLVRLKKSKSG